MGTRSWSKGRLYRIKNHLDIARAIPYARVMEWSTLVRRRSSLRCPFRLVWTSLLVMFFAGPLQVHGQTGSGSQACGGNSTVDTQGAKTAASARAFLAQLQAAVQSNNKEQITEMISYPLLVLYSGKRTHIREEGVPDKLRAHLYGLGAQCHSASDGRMSFWQLHRGNGRER